MTASRRRLPAETKGEKQEDDEEAEEADALNAGDRAVVFHRRDDLWVYGARLPPHGVEGAAVRGWFDRSVLAPCAPMAAVVVLALPCSVP